MENPELLKQVEAKAQVWLGEAYDEATRKEVKRQARRSWPSWPARYIS